MYGKFRRGFKLNVGASIIVKGLGNTGGKAAV